MLKSVLDPKLIEQKVDKLLPIDNFYAFNYQPDKDHLISQEQ